VPAFKDDAYYDTCPKDQCLTVDRSFKHGGTDNKGEEHVKWAMYNADPRKGGCGNNWARDTKQGVAANNEKGRDPKWKAESAELDRTFSMPSDAYRDNYERIFGHK
jgi:hypothetical protein